MDVEINPPNEENLPEIDPTVPEFIKTLILNPDVLFKSQQRDESDLSDHEKTKIAVNIFNTSKLQFLSRFGKYLQMEHMQIFRKFVDQSDIGIEIGILLYNLELYHNEDKRRRNQRNRRYKALEKLIDGNSYFSDTEMMKRNPLLYNQLVGQYLSEEERRSRDKAASQDTLVKILMEGIERDNARDVQKQQEVEEDNAMEEEDSSDEESPESRIRMQEILQAEASSSTWGEFPSMKDNRINKEEFYPKRNKITITATERQLLREEFVTFMHQSFLDGKDEDFDYTTVDNNEEYDYIEIVTRDEEDKYFDSEEPDDADMTEIPKQDEDSSEDDLDIYMNALNQHPAVCSLSNDFKKL